MDDKTGLTLPTNERQIRELTRLRAKQEPSIRLTAAEIAEIRRTLKKIRSITKDSPQAAEITDLIGRIDDILGR